MVVFCEIMSLVMLVFCIIVVVFACKGVVKVLMSMVLLM